MFLFFDFISTCIYISAQNCLNLHIKIRSILTIALFNRLVSGAGDIKLTKDGNVLLNEMVWFFVLLC